MHQCSQWERCLIKQIKRYFLQIIFSDSEGHIPDTPENRRILVDVANDPSSVLGTDKYGNTWYAKVIENGQQVWVQVNKNTITNGGINKTLKVFNSEAGLKAISSKNR